MDRITQMIWERAITNYMNSSLPEDKYFNELDEEEQGMYYRSAESELSNEDAFEHLLEDSFDDENDEYSFGEE